jgi:hypothetical protein
MDEDDLPPCDWRWFTPHQYEALLRVLALSGGMAMITELYDGVRVVVDLCRDKGCTQGQTIRHVMACTRDGHPSIEQSDLIPITRGILTFIYEELPE